MQGKSCRSVQCGMCFSTNLASINTSDNSYR
uniref:Uncharacterized protein n=1 Tax=Anguilla anguilla TaxID=7936 RepID=A0A0E9P941_ANGAN